MRFSTLEQHLSVPRIHRYLQICANKTRAKKLYDANLKLSRDFHPLLGMMEVVLRNCIYEAVAIHFNNSDWILTESQAGGFMNHRSLARGRYVMKRQVDKSIAVLTRKGVHHISASRILAEQTFAFWTDLFEPHHYNMLRQSPINAFSNLPNGIQRSDISDKLNKIRRFRNRINHNEPILFRGNTIDLSVANDVYMSIIVVFNWIDPTLAGFIRPVDNVPRTMSYCGRI